MKKRVPRSLFLSLFTCSSPGYPLNLWITVQPVSFVPVPLAAVSRPERSD
jgi:hypothetical protein